MEIIYVPIHIISLIYTMFNVAKADHMGFKWISGRVSVLDEKKVSKYHKGAWIGLILMIVTGSLIFSVVKANILYPQFYIKMGFVGALIVNGFVIGKLLKTSTKKSFASLSMQERIPFVLSGAVSTISWLGAATMALFILAE